MKIVGLSHFRFSSRAVILCALLLIFAARGVFAAVTLEKYRADLQQAQAELETVIESDADGEEIEFNKTFARVNRLIPARQTIEITPGSVVEVDNGWRCR